MNDDFDPEQQEKFKALLEQQRTFIEATITSWFADELDHIDAVMRDVYGSYTKGEPESTATFFISMKQRAGIKEEIFTLANKIILDYQATLGHLWQQGVFGFTEGALHDSLAVYLASMGVRLKKLEGACLASMEGFCEHKH